MQAPVWGFRGERPILRTAVRAQGPGPGHLGMKGGTTQWARTRSWEGEGKGGGGENLDFVLKEEPPKAALKNMVLSANT